MNRLQRVSLLVALSSANAGLIAPTLEQTADGSRAGGGGDPGYAANGAAQASGLPGSPQTGPGPEAHAAMPPEVAAAALSLGASPDGSISFFSRNLPTSGASGSSDEASLGGRLSGLGFSSGAPGAPDFSHGVAAGFAAGHPGGNGAWAGTGSPAGNGGGRGSEPGDWGGGAEPDAVIVPVPEVSVPPAVIGTIALFLLFRPRNGRS